MDQFVENPLSHAFETDHVDVIPRAEFASQNGPYIAPGPGDWIHKMDVLTDKRCLHMYKRVGPQKLEINAVAWGAL